MQFKAGAANLLWAASNFPASARFERALNQPAETQWRLLRNCLARNAHCAYGRKHGFAGIRSYREFAERVPLAGYDDLEPWINRIANGEKDILASEPVTRLIPTSGSSGARKLIPFTAGLQRDFTAAIAPWVCDLFRSHPPLLFGPAYWSISPALQPGSSHAAIPIGFDDDSSYLGGFARRLVNSAIAVPSEVRLIRDTEIFRYVTLLCLLRQRALRFISVWHPSFLTLLLDALPAEFEDLLGDIRSGRCKHEKALPASVLNALKLRALPKRAAELRKADAASPSTLWPGLKAISCWGDGPAELALSHMRRRFPGIFIQPKGLLATEGVVTIPFRGAYPAAVRSHFLEFVDERNQVRPVHELREQETCEVVLTTAGGLWRYSLGDLVLVTGFLGRTPTLRFLGRGGGITSLFGEKLSEAFVAGVVRGALELCGLRPSFAMLAPDETATGCGYTLYAQGRLPGSLAGVLDRMLRENPHYAYCRDLGQLQPVRIFAISAAGYEIFAKRRAGKGARAGEIKPTLLGVERDWSNFFPGYYVKAFESMSEFPDVESVLPKDE